MTTKITSSENHAHRIGIAAYLLLGLAATMPFVVASFGGMSAFDAGRLLGQIHGPKTAGDEGYTREGIREESVQDRRKSRVQGFS
jgi:hypothetical protein